MIARTRRILQLCFLILGALILFYYFKAPAQIPTLYEASGIQDVRLYTSKQILSADIDGDIILYLTQEEGTASLRVEADSVLLPYIEVSINDNQLIARKNTGSITVLNAEPATLYLFVADIASLTAHNNAKIIVENELCVDSLDLNTRGNGVIQAFVHTKQLDVESHGSSRIHLKGTTFEQYLDLSGSSRYEAHDLKSLECAIHASGTTIAQLCVTELFHGDLSGASNVTFFGNPKNIVTTFDSSKLIQKQLNDDVVKTDQSLLPER